MGMYTHNVRTLCMRTNYSTFTCMQTEYANHTYTYACIYTHTEYACIYVYVRMCVAHSCACAQPYNVRNTCILVYTWSIRVYAWVYACLCDCMCSWVHVYVWECTYQYAYICESIFTCVRVCIYVRRTLYVYLSTRVIHHNALRLFEKLWFIARTSLHRENYDSYRELWPIARIMTHQLST